MNSLSLVLAAASLAMLSILDGIPSSANSKFVASHRCSYGYAYADGCSAAPSDGNYVNPHFFLYAKQSGQKAYFRAPFVQSNHPPAWNVAGVDYPVGYRRSIKLKDPTSGQLPKGCRLSKGNVAAAVICDNVKDVVFDGWDFGAQNCIPLDIKAGVSGTVIIRNSRFANGVNCSVKDGFLVMVEATTHSDFVFSNNFVTGNVRSFPRSLMALVAPFVSGKVTIEYNAFLNSPARPIITCTSGPLYVAFNYWEGFVYHDNDGHGEVLVDAFHSRQSSQIYSFNTSLQTREVYAGSTTTFYTTANYPDAVIDSVQVDHNVAIANLAGGRISVAATISENCCHRYGSVLIEDNYADPTGSYYIFGSTGSPVYDKVPIFHGNINMLNGKTVNSFNTIP